MTSEERERMNSLCVGIQEETDYNKFAVLLQEMGELIARKEHRRFQQHPKLVWQRNTPWKTVPAVVIENNFADVDGGPAALTNGARLDVTFEAETKKTD